MRAGAWVMGARLPVAALVCALSAAGALAQGQGEADQDPPDAPPQASVIVVEQTCAPPRYDAGALWKALQLELSDLGVRAERVPADQDAARSAAADALALVTVECAEDADQLILHVSDAASGKELARTLGVADIEPAARSRALALAVVSLLESSWSEVVPAPSAAGSAQPLPAAVQAALRARLVRKLSVGAPAQTRQPVVAPERVPEFRHAALGESPPENLFEAGLALRGFPARGTGLVGLELGWLRRLTAPLRLAIIAEALWGRSDPADTADGTRPITLYWLTAGGGLSMHTDSHPEFELGPRMLLGYGMAHGKITAAATKAQTESGLVLSALLAFSIRAPLGDLQLTSGADIGYTLIGVALHGDGTGLSGMADTTFELRTALAW